MIFCIILQVLVSVVLLRVFFPFQERMYGVESVLRVLLYDELSY